ncbi:DUF2442 domain-containing protein [Gallibacterium anatis]|uniref:DUF2442 domain-containing protein n=1 Tax=Gallibacterium anatis (strain UMN179) TaxID=1005058 RepID=F4HBN2_GALAU|nr:MULTISPECIES: DUF2442 domain-containing protein [Gallibacterium]AEC16389.1 hypothetical protein UMN179_00352 [Gallibacterium anatis UMN179]MDA3978076.1 DUF2442 domain-containing protein [Gallibacterium sp. AGMB14963]
MNSLKPAVATKVLINDDNFQLILKDGRTLGIPFDWFPRLKSASQAERENYDLSPIGDDINWWDLDLNLSVNNLLLGYKEFNPGWSLQEYLARNGITPPKE